MQIKTIEDVQLFIDTLVATDMLWHADDLVVDIPTFRHLTKPEALQEMMNTAIAVCNEHGYSIFHAYPKQPD